MKFFAIVLTLLSLVPACGKKQTKRPVKEIIPMTVSNLKGHKMLYNEGWAIVTSTKRSLAFAHKYAIRSSRQEMLKIAQEMVTRHKEYGQELKEGANSSYQQAVLLLKTANKSTKRILGGTFSAGKSVAKWTGASFAGAWNALIRGNMSILPRTKEDREELAKLPGGFFRKIKNDLSNLYSLHRFAQQVISQAINLSWSASFKQAKEEFHLSYERSGERPNALVALVDIIAGYGKALYYGILKPTTKSVAKGAAVVANYGVFLPTLAATTIAGRVIQTTGLTLFYTTKLGIKLVTPTIEAGLLTGLTLLGATSVPIIYAGGTMVGAINQLALTALSPVYGTTRAVVTTAAATVKHAALVVYNVGKRSAKIALNQIMAGVVLGYNALVALPMHLFMSAVDTVVFLAWDGPRLVIAAARGEIGTPDGEQHTVGDLPVGSVVDLKKLKKHKGVSVRVISRDPETIRRVLKRLPQDLRHTPPATPSQKEGAPK